MKPLSETYKELGISFTFPIVIKNDKGYCSYFEGSNGYWSKSKYDSNGKLTYYEDSDDYWCRYEYDADGNETHYENSVGNQGVTPRKPELGFDEGFEEGYSKGYEEGRAKGFEEGRDDEAFSSM